MKQRTIRLAATGARVATGAVIAVGCVLGVVAAVAAPWPQVTHEPATAEVTPVPGDTTLVCNGSFRVLGRDASQAELMVSAASPRVRVESQGEAPESTELAMPDVTGGGGAQSLTGRVVDRQAPLFAASEAVGVADEDLNGFAAAPCREPSLHTWLVGGDMTTGASDIIVLSNPGTVPATVDLNVYGEERAATTTVIPARTQVGLPLASVAAGQQQPVVEVRSSGAPVRASLQSATVRTLDAVGIDIQDGVTGPQTEQIMLGVRVSKVTEGDDSSGVLVRLLSPGADTQATVRVRAAGSAVVVDEYPVDLLAAKPTEIALTGIPEGAYDVEIVAGEPIVAAARQTARAGAAEDFSWMLPAPQLAERATTMFSVPGGAPATLYLRNAEDEAITVDLDGQSIELAAGESTSESVRAGAHTLSATGRMHAAVGMRGGEGSAAIAGWPLWAGAITQQPITVRP